MRGIGRCEPQEFQPRRRGSTTRPLTYHTKTGASAASEAVDATGRSCVATQIVLNRGSNEVRFVEHEHLQRSALLGAIIVVSIYHTGTESIFQHSSSSSRERHFIR